MRAMKFIFDVVAFPFYVTFVMLFVCVLFTLNTWDEFVFAKAKMQKPIPRPPAGNR